MHRKFSKYEHNKICEGRQQLRVKKTRTNNYEQVEELKESSLKYKAF